MLSRNPNGTHLLEKNPEKIYWGYFSANPNAIHFLEKNLERVDWSYLSANPNAIHLLEKNPDKINWYRLSWNQAIFQVDYQVLKNRIEPFKEELIARCFHPDRLVRYLELYQYDIGDDEYQDYNIFWLCIFKSGQPENLKIISMSE